MAGKIFLVSGVILILPGCFLIYCSIEDCLDRTETGLKYLIMLGLNFVAILILFVFGYISIYMGKEFIITESE